MTTTLPTKPPSRHPGRRSWVVGLSALAMVGVLAWPTSSYVEALTYPGQASFPVRTVEWVRDHGGGPLVDLLETWWYSEPPSAAAPDGSALPPAAPATRGRPEDPAPIPVIAPLTPLRGEGRWAVIRKTTAGTAALSTTFERPDPGHPSIVVGVARLDQRATRLRLIAGTTQPDKTHWQTGAQVPPDARDRLAATFNSGFKLADAHGGSLIDGHAVGALRVGAATVAIRGDGHATVGQWGRDFGAAPDVVAVRQNLDLVVDQGKPVAALADNTGNRWGTTRNQTQYTWRSGLGVDGTGNLLYVGGASLNLTTLAHALVQAGAIRGMQLDIHTEMVDFYSYPVGAARVATGMKLLPDMAGSVNRYLVPDQRDFFAATLR
jgi:hypothetical protein